MRWLASQWLRRGAPSRTRANGRGVAALFGGRGGGRGEGTRAFTSRGTASCLAPHTSAETGSSPSDRGDGLYHRDLGQQELRSHDETLKVVVDRRVTADELLTAADTTSAPPPPPPAVLVAVQDGLVGLQAALGLPWYATIALGAVGLRAALFPLVYYSLHVGKRQAAASPELARLSTGVQTKLRELNERSRAAREAAREHLVEAREGKGGGGGGGTGVDKASRGDSDSPLDIRATAAGGSGGKLDPSELAAAQRVITREKLRYLGLYFTGLRMIHKKHGYSPLRCVVREGTKGRGNGTHEGGRGLCMKTAHPLVSLTIQRHSMPRN